MYYDFKEFVSFVVISIINIIIAYAITIPLGIQNVLLYKSLTAVSSDISYEVIIWFALTLIEAYVYEKIILKKSEVF